MTTKKPRKQVARRASRKGVSRRLMSSGPSTSSVLEVFGTETSVQTERKEPNYVMKGFCHSNYDGDTAVLTVSPAFKVTFEQYKFRFHAIDTYELNAKDSEKRRLAGVARDYVAEKIVGKNIIVQTIKNSMGSAKIDDFGRYLAIIYYDREDGTQVNLNAELLELGLAVPWSKKRRKA